MQISKINSVNFKGLWEIKSTECKERVEDYGSKVFFDEAIYHPFKDETSGEIEQTLREERLNPVYECDDDRVNDPYGPDHYVITKHTLGSRLNITYNEYSQIKSMTMVGHPETDYPLYYSTSSSRKYPIQKIMDENDV